MSAAAVALAGETHATRRRTILVVDDVPLLRELGALFLARAGRVLTAASGEEALALVHLESPELIVANVRVPGIDGAALCRAVKADPELAGIRVVLLASTQESQECAVRAGADDVLTKPLDRVVLLDTVRRLLAESPRGLPRVAIEEPVELRLQRVAWAGVARNVSRGGVFVETPRLVRPRGEVALSLRLPETDAPLASAAQVIWTCEEPPRGAPGMGLRFLGLDRRSARALSDWVSERVPRHPTAEESTR